MKKRVLLIAAIVAGVFTTYNVNAQDFKPEAGAKNIEINFTPFGDTPIDINSVKLRFFKSADFVIRLGVHINSNSTDDADGVSEAAFDFMNDFGANRITNYEASQFEFGIDFGFEKHWAGTDRLSPYWGVEVGVGYVSTTEESNDIVFGSGSTDLEFTSSATLFGANLLIGADYYFAPKFYFGTEIGLGFVSRSTDDIEITSSGNKTTLEGPSSFEFGEDVNSAIRVGFIF